jgi:hypothetical protein
MFARFVVFQGTPVLFYLVVLFSVGCFCLYFLIVGKIYQSFHWVFFMTLVVISLSFSSLVSSLSLGLDFRRFLYFGALLASNAAFAYVLNAQRLSWKIISLYMIFISLFSFYLMYEGINPNMVFENSSRNTFSILLLEASALLYIVIIQRNDFTRFPLWPAILSFVISVWAIGRSGILSTGFLLCGVILANFLESRKKLRYFVFTGVMVSCALILFIGWQSESFALVVGRFSTEGLKESHRVEIATHYFQQIAENPLRLFFGYDVQFDQYLANVWNSNLHNSFLKLHSIIGIGAIVLLFLIVRGIYKKGKTCMLLWFIGGALLLRAATDTAFLFGPTDFLFFYFLFRDRDCLQRTDRPVKLSIGTQCMHERNEAG